MAKIYNNLFQLILEARAHVVSNNSKVISADNPKQLLFGWMCDKTNKHFLLTLSSVRYRKAFTPIHNSINENTIEFFSKCFSTYAGKKQIADFINTKLDIEEDFSKYLNRVCKLKAFW